MLLWKLIGPTHLGDKLMRIQILAAAIALLCFAMTGAAQAELKVGDAAPDFKLAGSDGKTYQLSELKDTTVVLAWFPKAFTGG